MLLSHAAGDRRGVWPFHLAGIGGSLAGGRRSFGLRRTRSCRRGGRRRGSRRLVDGRQHVAGVDRFAFSRGDLAEHAALVRGDIDVDLLRLELHQRFASFHRLTFVLEPGAYRRLDDRFTQHGNADVNRHGFGLLRASR